MRFETRSQLKTKKKPDGLGRARGGLEIAEEREVDYGAAIGLSPVNGERLEFAVVDCDANIGKGLSGLRSVAGGDLAKDASEGGGVATFGDCANGEFGNEGREGVLREAVGDEMRAGLIGCELRGKGFANFAGFGGVDDIG